MITAEQLREAVSYDPETGIFTRRLALSNRVKPGDIPGSRNQAGYLLFLVHGRRYRAHRLAWLYMTGEWPDVIDHINGIKADNRWANLRSVSGKTNRQNIRAPKANNASGFLGVIVAGQKFRAALTANGKTKYIGVFDTAQEAHDAYLAEKRKLHPGCTL